MLVLRLAFYYPACLLQNHISIAYNTGREQIDSVLINAGRGIYKGLVNLKCGISYRVIIKYKSQVTIFREITLRNHELIT